MSVPAPPLDLDLKVIKKGTCKLLEYREFKRKIRPLIQVTQKAPQSDFQKKFFDDEALTDADLEDETLIPKANDMLDELKSKVEQLNGVAKDLWVQVNENWNELEQCHDPFLEMTNARVDIIEALQNLIRKQNFAKERQQELIVKNTLEIREELTEIWKQCMVRCAEDANFLAFHRTDYTRDLLEIHRTELVRWKSFLAKHQMLFDQIERRSNLWIRMRELQLKAEDPNRFINRGGALLQSQKEMNSISTALPKCEAKLVTMAQNFEKENGRKLLIHGMEISELIKKDWEDYKQGIKKRAAVKQPVKRTSSRREPLSAPRTGERSAVLGPHGNVLISAEKRKAREGPNFTPPTKKAKSKSKSTVVLNVPDRIGAPVETVRRPRRSVSLNR